MTLNAVFEEGKEFTAAFETESGMDAAFEEVTEVSGNQYRFGDGLKYDANTRTVSVDKADVVAEGDHRPVTSAAVQVQIGNIEALLQTI